MATQLAVFPVAIDRSTQISVATTASSSSVVIGSSDSGTIFVITSDNDITIRVGNATTIGNPDGTDFPIWANSYVQFALPTGCDRFRVYGKSGATALVNYWQLARS